MENKNIQFKTLVEKTLWKCVLNALRMYAFAISFLIKNFIHDIKRFPYYVWQIVKLLCMYVTYLALIPIMIFCSPVLLIFWLPYKTFDLMYSIKYVTENRGPKLMRYKLKRRKGVVRYSVLDGVLYEIYKSKGRYKKNVIADLTPIIGVKTSAYEITGQHEIKSKYETTSKYEIKRSHAYNLLIDLEICEERKKIRKKINGEKI